MIIRTHKVLQIIQWLSKITSQLAFILWQIKMFLFTIEIYIFLSKWKFRFRGQWWEGQLIYFNFEDSKFESRFFWKERGSNDSLKEQGIFEISKYFIKNIYLQICTLNHVGKNKQIYLQKYRLIYRKVFQIHCIRSVAKNGVSWNFKLRRWQYF